MSFDTIFYSKRVEKFFKFEDPKLIFTESLRVKVPYIWFRFLSYGSKMLAFYKN